VSLEIYQLACACECRRFEQLDVPIGHLRNLRQTHPTTGRANTNAMECLQ
jgi:hypothetical protein